MTIYRLASIVLCCLAYHALAQASTITSVVSVYSTTTVSGPSKSDDWNHACDNFVGACVVYGSGTDGAASYTTTVYLTGSSPPSSPSPSAVVTFSTTIPATVTVTADSTGACGDFTGACVVYGSGSGAASTTMFASAGASGSNNGDGVIGQNSGGDGQIGGSTDKNGQLGSASALQMWTTASAVGLLALAFAFLLGL